MAVRKNPQVTPVLDNSSTEKEAQQVVALDKQKFANVIRWINTGPVDRARSIREGSFRALKRLGVSRNMNKAQSDVPDGSDQVSVGTILAWMKRIESGHRKAIRQLVAIDATCVARGSR